MLGLAQYSVLTGSLKLTFLGRSFLACHAIYGALHKIIYFGHIKVQVLFGHSSSVYEMLLNVLVISINTGLFTEQGRLRNTPYPEHNSFQCISNKNQCVCLLCVC
jgi:hypothetical protein